MKSIFLEKIVLRFPKTDFRFANGFLQLLDETGSRKGGIFGFEASQEDFYPKVFLDFESEERALVCDFLFSDRTQESVKIENVTGLTRKSPLSYGLLDIETIQKRLKDSGIRILGVDHVGFNLPWFSSPLHPAIEDLRKKLADRCLYHKFPTGEPWDFIIPGTRREIDGSNSIDYSMARNPKFEIVSFKGSSTPLVQIDASVDSSHENLSQLFPEALSDSNFKNIWAYLENAYGADLCLVLNEPSDKDWSGFFRGNRL